MAATKEFLRNLRRKHHLGEFSTKHGSTGRKARRRGGFMARKVRHHRRGGGMGGIMKPAIVGLIAGAVGQFGQKMTYTNNKFMPFQTQAAGAGAGVAGNMLFGAKGMKGLAIGAVAGTAGAIGVDMLMGGSGGTSGSSNF